MQWTSGRRSDNVEDRRGMRASTGLKLGGGAVLLIAVVAMLLGEDPRQILSTIERSGATRPDAPAPPGGGGTPGAYDEQKDFLAVVLADTEDTWGKVLPAMGRQYQAPKLVLFADAVDSACGMTSSAVGPFYCPGDAQVYLDLGFFHELDRRFGAPGDFARAYVVAHEVGHHIQNLLGISDQVDELRSRLDREEQNALSVRVELQADCFAGVWGHHAHKDRHLLEPGDIDEGLAAAAAIGDDRMQREAGRRVNPESWTHGSSDMRQRWFKRGFESGRVESCDTYKADRL
jgi:hypothetical protein